MYDLSIEYDRVWPYFFTTWSDDCKPTEHNLNIDGLQDVLDATNYLVFIGSARVILRANSDKMVITVNQRDDSPVLIFSSCDKCGENHAVVQRLNTGGGGGVFLCRKCWETEMEYRSKRNAEVANEFEIREFLKEKQ